MTEVLVAGYQGEVMVQACLGDQRIRKSTLPALRNDLGAEESSSFPESLEQRQERKTH